MATLCDVFCGELSPLKSFPNFVFYGRAGTQGKAVKHPYQLSRSGKPYRASSKKPETWRDYDSAYAILKAQPNLFEGLGFEFSLDTGLVFWDIDHCVYRTENASGVPSYELSEVAQYILEKLGSCSYVELSRSGTGLHGITRGTIPRGFNNQHTGEIFHGVEVHVEMYAEGRYCALTGNVFEAYSSPISCNQEGLSEVFEKFKTKDKPKRASRGSSQQETSQEQIFSDDEIITRAGNASASGEDFRALFSGEWEGLYGSQSEADLRLCQLLAFWADRDFDTIDRIFCTSGLYREKWDREDYKEATIEKACGHCEESFSEYRDRKLLEDFEIMEENVSIDQDILDKLNSLNPDTNPLYKELNDISAGRLFAEVFRDHARYNPEAELWFVYDGKIWKPDKGGMAVERYAKSLYDALWMYSSKVRDTDFRNAVHSFGSRQKRKKMIEDSREVYHICYADLDSADNLFNCQNGVLNLDTLIFMPHSPDLLLSKVSNVYFKSEARSEVFENFMSQIMLGNNEKISYIQKIFGYCLTPSTAREEMYIFYGATTRNGKGTLIGTIAHAFGDYARAITPETLAQMKKDSRTANPEIAMLRGCRLTNCSEPKKGMVFDEAFLKTLTGGDRIRARSLFENGFEYEPNFKIVINTNFLPQINDDTLFSSDRIKVVTFDRHYTEEERDLTLKDRLRTPENISGVFNWCVEGLRKLKEEGMNEPQEVRDAISLYRKKSDKLGLFVEECLSPSMGHNLAISEVYKVFRDWSNSSGYVPESKRNFIDDLKQKKLYKSSGTVEGTTKHNVIPDHAFSEEGFNFLI